ncbi:type II secretion system F family protein [Stenotrophomonas sp. CFBP 13725]|uniref:type II secretion system F family protein n=1 Tax=Stenotrophomonas sp. CFBP 13725 TaxID=2775297 RepID=UPI001783273A|nr:type II secretion system F family protein [Stenotrophomonas sp. CFBP 13725]MBD8634639.1 type II secretion system F family protein [Stenotrophomonas sp. CFBP 13725]
MSPTGWWTLSLLLFAASVALFGALYWIQAVRQQRSDATLQSALQPRASTVPTPAAPRSALAWLEAIGQRFSGGRIERALLASEDRMLLDLGGWNTRRGTAIYVALRLLLAVAIVLPAPALVDAEGAGRVFTVIAALAAGLLLPKIVLGIWAGRRRKRVNDELPMLIDLLRLLQGVGYSMDQSLQTLGEKLRPALPVLGREIHDANIAYAHGRSRSQSLRRLGEAYDDDDLRSLVQLILQVHAHGGAVQEPLKQFSLRLREQRRHTLKEKVGKLSVKMTVVMMLTLLPALMLVLSGPALLALASTLTRI